MFKHILIPSDGSALADKAIKAGIEFASETGARITVYQAIEARVGTYYGDGYTVSEMTSASLQRQAQERAEETFTAARKAAAAVGVTCDGLATESGSPYQGILAAAKKRKCDAIFMASHGRGGLGSLLLGSVTNEVLAHSTLPVLVYR